MGGESIQWFGSIQVGSKLKIYKDKLDIPNASDNFWSNDIHNMVPTFLPKKKLFIKYGAVCQGLLEVTWFNMPRAHLQLVISIQPLDEGAGPTLKKAFKMKLEPDLTCLGPTFN